ncbi:TetR/AcrR family transcriptional regulator [Nonomuraea ferruginea]|uniref:Helix-turn-helix domain containing protein n=1 Tax=Nonomuraea ferruginea TaxID=46174 RepID=A0ABT4TC46_9ACTN|nr:TetR/AcrR family transcriptional regulator [Nonomuraea ferruginea]MDA0647107.1 helix-turn-helix domain containing protein [Nonomuraea ferruginea]
MRDSGLRRRDAVRNRGRLLAAARRVFAEHGHEVALAEIARAADVSRTTLYRNFGSREELAATVYEDNIVRIEERAAELRGSDTGALELFEFVLDMQLASRSIAPILPRSAGRFDDLAARTADAFRPLVEDAARAGTVREGVGLTEVLLAIRMAEVFAAEEDAGVRARHHARGRVVLRHGLFPDEVVARVPEQPVARRG